MQTQHAVVVSDHTDSPGLHGPENRKVKVGRRKSRTASRKFVRTQAKGCRKTLSLSRVLAQDGGGQGVLSRPEGEGSRADPARGRMTPARAIESSVIGSHQRSGLREDERRLDGTR